jgi:hypothetical protein
LNFAKADDYLQPEGIYYYLPDDNMYNISKGRKIRTFTEGIGVGLNIKIHGNLLQDKENKNGVISYFVNDGDVTICSFVTDYFNNNRKNGWELYSDTATHIDGMDMKFRDEKHSVKNGALIYQVSADGQKWVNIDIINPIYEDKNIYKLTKNPIEFSIKKEYINTGFFFRIILAYEIRTVKNEKSFFEDKYKYTNYMEVFEFYLHNAATGIDFQTSQQFRLGKLIKTENDFSGRLEITPKDKHYPFDVGNFYITGYSSHLEEGGTQIFLKNVGDRIVLWFDLEQDINALNGNPKLQISSDKNVADQYFRIPRTNFYRGAFIIRKTDYQNIEQDPIIYENFLEASALPFTNTKIDLLEEGDYDAALDYSIGKDHYRIPFAFKIRNGNAMIFPFDLQTGSELSNRSYTENGFYLDLAKSRYLKPIVKKETLADGASGLTEDTRFNRPAKDGDKYTEEGIYTISVTNPYTDKTTEKIIYVGTNKILKAYAVTGLPIMEIRQMLDKGAKIQDDGQIFTATPTLTPTATFTPTATNTPEPMVTPTITDTPTIIVESRQDENKETSIKPQEKSFIEKNQSLLILAGTIVVVFIVWFIITYSRRKKTSQQQPQVYYDQQVPTNPANNQTSPLAPEYNSDTILYENGESENDSETDLTLDNNQE